MLNKLSQKPNFNFYYNTIKVAGKEEEIIDQINLSSKGKQSIKNSFILKDTFLLKQDRKKSYMY